VICHIGITLTHRFRLPYGGILCSLVFYFRIDSGTQKNQK